MSLELLGTILPPCLSENSDHIEERRSEMRSERKRMLSPSLESLDPAIPARVPPF